MVKDKGAIRYRIVNHKRRPLCDFHGTCKNLAYCEVYPSLLGGKYENKGWDYLCRKHLEQEKRKFRNKLPYCKI